MSDLCIEMVVSRIATTHQLLMNAIEPLPEDEFIRPPSKSAPPIGWHLWHAARWVDRMQASLPREYDPADYIPDPGNDIWTRERLLEEWGLDGEQLGKLQAGVHMEHAYAAQVAVQAGKERVFAYAEKTFDALNEVLAGLSQEQVEADRISVMFDPGNPEPDGSVQAKYNTTTIADLGFVLSHSSRHLGMVEALRGLTGRDGSASA